MRLVGIIVLVGNIRQFLVVAFTQLVHRFLKTQDAGKQFGRDAYRFFEFAFEASFR